MIQQTDHIGDVNKMVTAVEFLIKAFRDAYGERVTDIIYTQVEQARIMEVEQTEEAKAKGYNLAMSDAIKEIHKNYQPIN